MNQNKDEKIYRQAGLDRTPSEKFNLEYKSTAPKLKVLKLRLKKMASVLVQRLHKTQCVLLKMYPIT